MKPTRQQIALQLKALDPAIRAVLIYGPDEGLVRERARQIAQQVVSDEKDAFRVARPNRSDIIAAPGKLADEMGALSLTGGRRLVRIDGADERILQAIDEALSDTTGDTLLLVTGAELGPRSKLRRGFESAADRLAIPCYREEGAALEALVRQRAGEKKVRLNDDAVRALADAIAGNRALLDLELEKLATFLGNQELTLDLPQIVALIGGAAELELRDLAAAMTAGDLARLDVLIDRAQSEGQAAISILRVVTNRLRQLHYLRGAMDRGQSFEAAAQKLRPPLFFKDKPALRRDVGRWPLARIAAALKLTLEAERQCKSDVGAAEAISARTCLRLAASVTSRRQPATSNH